MDSVQFTVWEKPLLNQGGVMVECILLDRIERGAGPRLQVALPSLRDRNRVRIQHRRSHFHGRQQTALIQSRDLHFRRRPIVGAERDEDPLRPNLAVHNVGLSGEVS